MALTETQLTTTTPADVALRLARPEDDEDIRHLLANSPVPGRVELTFEHEPSYFLGCQTMGPFTQVIVGRHEPTDELAGIACRATRLRFVNGRAEEVGYLTHLRVDPRFRGRWLVSHGYRFMRELHADGRVGGYITIIGEENAQAMGILVSRRRGHIPLYREVARLASMAFVIRGPKRVIASSYEIRRGSETELGEIVACLRQHGSAKQFFPVYSEEDFCRDSKLTLGFRVGDFFIACRGREVVGVVGLWDRSDTKQAVVQGYSGLLRWARPAANVGARLVGAQPLPAPGERLSMAYASFICVADNEPELFRVLLRQAYNLAAERGYAYLIVDLAEHDPLLGVAGRYAHLTYQRRLYTVSWDDGEFHRRLDGRVPYVETAAL
jgi:hypothetical protein